MASKDNPHKKVRVSKSVKAGISLPVARIQRDLRTAEVLELAGHGHTAENNKKQRIIPRHIMMAIKNDSELNQLLGNVQIPASGVIPFIHEALRPKNSKARKGAQQEHAETDAEDVQSQEI